MSKTKKDIVGTRIGIYDVLYECDFKASDGHKMYHVQCVHCNYETDMKKSDIGKPTICHHITSDGRYIDYKLQWSNDRLKYIFHGMKRRCYNKNDKDYRWYGAKGVSICDEWLNNPKSFEDWAINNGYEDNLTIDRIYETKNYSPENCIWIPMKDNSRYKSTTSMIDVDGIVCTGREWSERLGFGVNQINTYIRKYGKENTIEFIRRYIKDPNKKTKNRQSYYDLYMN